MAGRLFAALALGRADGRYPKMLRALSSTDLLILDDWGPESLNADQRRNLLEIVEDRYNRGSVLITTQVPVGRWYEIIGNPTLADAILDRVIHNADLRWLAAGHTSSRPTAAACASRRRQ